MEQHKNFGDRLMEILIHEKICSQNDAVDILTMFKDSSKGRIDSFLLEENIVEKEKLLSALSKVYEVSSFDVKGYFFDHELLLLFPKDFLLENVIIPLKTEEDMLTVIMSNPEDDDLLETIGNYVSYDLNVKVGIAQDILDAIEEYYSIDVVSKAIEAEEMVENDEPDDSDIVDFIF